MGREGSLVHDYLGFLPRDYPKPSARPYICSNRRDWGGSFSTSARFTLASGDAKAVPLAERSDTADRKVSSGVYLVHIDGEAKVHEALSNVRE